MSLQNLLRLIEEIYSFRYSYSSIFCRYQKDTQKLQNTGSHPTDKALHLTVFEFLNQKFKQKKMLDQSTIDFIASLEHFRSLSSEVEVFYSFFI